MKPRQCPCRRRGRRDRHARRQPHLREPGADIVGQRLLAAEQMRDSTDVEPKRIRPVHLDQRRPALRPFRQPLD
jgi:hypothetical protein